jgi:hypothetical protein
MAPMTTKTRGKRQEARGKIEAARRFANFRRSLIRIALLTMRDETRPRGVREQAAAGLARHCEVPPNQIDACKTPLPENPARAGDSRAGLAAANAAQRIERVAQALNESSRE